MNLYEILEGYFPENYLDTDDEGEKTQFNPANFLSNTKDYFQAYDPFDEKMITKTSELAKSDVVKQNMFGTNAIKDSFSQQGFSSADFSSNIENYFSKLSSILSSQNASELLQINQTKENYRQDTIDRFQELIKLGLLDRPLNQGEVNEDFTVPGASLIINESGTTPNSCPDGYEFQYDPNTGGSCVPIQQGGQLNDDGEPCGEYETTHGLNGC